MPYLRVANVQRGYLDLANIAAIRVSAEKAKHLELRPGDVLLNEGGDRDKLGRGWIWEGQIEGCIHQNHVFRARIYDNILHPKLLAWHANSFGRQWFQDNGTQSVNLASISLSTIKSFPVPVPPLAEQRRIVAALDYHVSRLDHGRSLLACAAKKATALEASFQDQLESEASSCSQVSLGELLAEPLRNGHSARVASGSVGVRSVTLTAVTKGRFIDKYTKLTAPDPNRVRDLWLRRGDILIQRSNTPELVGTVAMYDGKDDWAIFPDLLIRIRLQDRVAPAYAAMMLSTRRVRHYFRRSAKGLAGSMPKIDQSTVAAVRIPLPALSRQLEIVERMQSLTALCNRAKDDAEVLDSRSAALRRSLFSYAFAGRLAPQDPDDQPASELLAPIPAGRATVSTRGRRSARTPKQPPPPSITATTDDYQQEELPL
jgi:type I restriction enzyme S subunit